jgi:hypothetical protein
VSALTDLAVSAIQKAIESDPKSAVKLHAAVMLHGKDHVGKAFGESEAFVGWREIQRTVGRVEELLFVTKRLAGMVDRYNARGDVSMGAEFTHLMERLLDRAHKLAEPLSARGVHIPGLKEE